MCLQNSGHKDDTLVNTYECTNNCFDEEVSDIYAVGLGTNNNVAYASIYMNNSTCHKSRDNVTYNDLKLSSLLLCD